MRRPSSLLRPASRLLLVLGLLLSLLPGIALAGPQALAPAQDAAAAEDGAPQVYVSDLLPAADGVGRIITLVLAADGGADWSTNFLNGEPPIVEQGTWSAGESEGALLVSITGSEEEAYDTPIDFAFAADADGTLTAEEWNEALFGSEALVLSPALPQTIALAGRYAAEALPAASSPGRDIVLELGYDRRAQLETDARNGEAPVVELGQWGATPDGDEIFVSFTGRPNAVYEAPIEWTFAVEDDTLTATEWDETIYGSEVLELARMEEEIAGADGVWVSQILPAASSPGQVVLLILYPNNTLQSSTWYLNNELPIIEDGSWADNGDGTVTLTVTGSSERTYETPQELIFDYDGETLTYLSLTLSRLEPVAPSSGPEPVAFYTSGVEPAADSGGIQRSLIFYDDNSVQLVSDFLNGEPPVVEEGSWAENEDASLTVTLTGTEDAAYAEPVVITFSLGDGTLTATEWDENLFGTAGLSFSEQDLDELMLEDEAPVSGEPAIEPAAVLTTTLDGESAAGAPVTTTVPATGTGAATETESVTGSEPTTAGAAADETAALLDLAQPFEAPSGAQAVYVSDVLPAASSPGRLLRLVLFEDGTNQLVTDFLNGEPPVLEIGTWAESTAGEIDVTISGQIASPYVEPIVTTFAQVDDTLVAVQWDEAIYGSEPLTLTLEPGN
jgi:uncharacterized lipoprotein NlpE involved in copper resistance